MVMESRDEQDNLVELSPELVAMLDKRQREWGTSSRGEVVEMLLGWMKKRQPKLGFNNYTNLLGSEV